MARYLTGSMATHTIGNDVEVIVVENPKGILVVAPFHTDIGFAMS